MVEDQRLLDDFNMFVLYDMPFLVIHSRSFLISTAVISLINLVIYQYFHLIWVSVIMENLEHETTCQLMVESNPKNRRIYVTGLDTRVDTETHERMLRREFARFGEIEDVSVSSGDPPQLGLGMPHFCYSQDIVISMGFAHILFTMCHAAFKTSKMQGRIEDQQIVCLPSAF